MVAYWFSKYEILRRFTPQNDSACLPDKTVWAGLPDWQGGYDTLIINWNTKLIGKSYEKLE
jgi:hypothetical protein